MKPILLYALALSPLLGLIFPARMLWKSWRRHQRFMAVMRDVNVACETLKTARTIEQLNGRGERIEELLEHAYQISREK
jgi:hypothetical protein